MDEDLYDEFGNLIGDPLDSDAESSDGSEFQQLEHEENGDSDTEVVDASVENRVILQEDKKFYSTMTETFGEDVETIVQTHDNQSINEPLVQSAEERVLKIEEKKLPKTTYSKEYLAQLLAIPSKVRNVALVGSLNSGKTSFLDNLILQTHQLKNVSKKSKTYNKLRYTDNTKLEIERGITIKVSAMTLLLQNLKGTSLAVNFVDSPGHVDFADEVAVSQRLCDISCVLVDVVEGLTIGGRRAIDNALMNQNELCFVINKVDRLILELKLPSQDAYFKIRNNIDEINTYVSENQYYDGYSHKVVFSPTANNVLFASSDLNFVFNLKSFAKLYAQRTNTDIDIDLFAKRLWGDIYFNEETHKFTTKADSKRTFALFVLDPIYKIVSQALSAPLKDLQETVYEEFGVSLSKDLIKSDPQILLKETFKLIFHDCSGFADVIESLSSPELHCKTRLFSGNSQVIKDALTKPSNEGPLVANIAKMVEDELALARIISGTIKVGDTVKILGEGFSEDDEEQLEMLTVEKLYISGGRYKVPTQEASTGAIVLIEGVKTISKSATMYGSSVPAPLAIFRPIDYTSTSVFKVIIEPQLPTEMQKLTDGLRKINKSYCGVQTLIENNVNVILGAGELYLDCLMYDLRTITDTTIKISDPITKFAETVIDQSFTKVSIKSQNRENEITVIAEPMEETLSRDLANKKLSPIIDKDLRKMLRESYKWDSLAARLVWRFSGTNALLDDTLSDEVDKESLILAKDQIIQGFEWAIRDGPLADEVVENTKFKILDAKISKDPFSRSPGQIIPMVTRACYSAILTSSPRLMEPIYSLEVVGTVKTIDIIDKILDKRRGAILKDTPIAGTQLYKVYGFVPVIDSIGLETDIRVATQGQALVSLFFEKFSLVPGDPLDKDVFIPKLKPAPINSLARDFVLKTRKRKGLSGEPSLAKYIDQELVNQLKELGLLI